MLINWAWGGAKVRIEKGYRARRANVLLQKYDAN